MTLLDDLANGRAGLAFADAGRRTRAAAAVGRGTDLTLRAQVRAGGRLTAWCAQHDEVTLEPRKARTYEHPSLSGFETAGIVRFLMARSDTDVRIVPAVEAAVVWLDAVKLEGWRLERRLESCAPRRLRPRDGPRLRRPAAVGAVLRHRHEPADFLRPRRPNPFVARPDRAQERRVGYTWVGDWPRALLTTGPRPGGLGGGKKPTPKNPTPSPPTPKKPNSHDSQHRGRGGRLNEERGTAEEL